MSHSLFNIFVVEEENKETSSAKKGLAANYKPLAKYYVFNQTGNIMIATTGEPLSEGFKSVCAEVSVFFATMTKAIHSITNPKTKQPYSIYNHAALKKVIESSGMFVTLHQKEIAFESDNVDEVFGKEFIESILGISLSNEDLHFANETFNAINTEATRLETAKNERLEARKFQARGIDDDNNEEDEKPDRVSNIIFVCESLMGMPMVSVVVAHFEADAEKQKQPKPATDEPHKESFFSRLFGGSPQPEKKEPAKHQLSYKKDTYLFVAPKFFKDYVVDLNTSETPEFKELVRAIKISLHDLANG